MTLKDDLDILRDLAKQNRRCIGVLGAYNRTNVTLQESRDCLRWMVPHFEELSHVDSLRAGVDIDPSVELQAAKGLLERLEGI